MTNTVFDRHPKKTLIAVMLFFLLIFLIMAEIVIRLTIPYDIGYYSATKAEGKYIYPYGTVEINALGYPDEEFDLDSCKRRIGYFGDSVTFGTGAGSGYRFSDLLQDWYPDYEHWTFGMISNGIQDSKIVETAEKYGLDTVVFAMNLNDIMPTPETAKQNKSAGISSLRNWVHHNLDGLRGKSYLYTWLRTSVKNALVRMGYGHTGFKAAELFPRQNLELIEDVASRINTAANALQENGIQFCLMILPYEMQISEDAAHTYAKLGISWDDGFTAGSTQTILRQYLDVPYLYNGIEAFQEIKNARVGEFYVYNKGDKIDFNHPNRAGHAVLAEGVIKSRFCPVFR